MLDIQFVRILKLRRMRHCVQVASHFDVRLACQAQGDHPNVYLSVYMSVG